MNALRPAAILIYKNHKSTFTSVVITTTKLKQSKKEKLYKSKDLVLQPLHDKFLSSSKGPVGFPGDPGPSGEPGIAVSMKLWSSTSPYTCKNV